MISPRLRIHQLDPEHYRNLTRLMHPPVGGDPEPRPWGPLAHLFPAPERRPEAVTALSPKMPVVILARGQRPVRAVQLGGGTLPLGELTEVNTETLAAYRRRHDLPLAVAVDVEALPELFGRAQSAVVPTDDYVAQLLAMTRVAKGALGSKVWVDPPPWGAVPLPPYRLLQATFNQILPDDRSLVFYLTDRGSLWTSLIAVKRGGDLTEVTSHGAIAHRVPFASPQRDAKATVTAVSEQLAPVHIGIFMPLRVWHELVAGDRSAVARALASRSAVLDPAPRWLLALVGAGAVAEAATRSFRLAGRLLSGSRLGSLIPGGVENAERLMKTVANPFETLGADPWEMLASSRDWARRLELDRSALRGEEAEG